MGKVGLILISLFIIPVKDDGRYAQSPLKSWFDTLANKDGALCCSDADGTALSDVQWESKGDHYRVFVPTPRKDSPPDWVDVPDQAIITKPNLSGRTMVWPLYGYLGVSIRCFIPGSMG